MKKVGIRLDESAFAELEARARAKKVSPTTLANELLSELLARPDEHPNPGEGDSLILILERLDEIARAISRPHEAAPSVAPRPAARTFRNALDAFIFGGGQPSEEAQQDELDFGASDEEEDE